MVERGDAADSAKIERFGTQYGLELPAVWRRWCERQGWQRQADAGWELLGLTPAPSGLDAAALLAGMRFGLPEFPSDLLPIEHLPERQLACIRLDGRDDPPVVIVDLDDSETWQAGQPAAFSRFSHYAEDFMDQAHALRRVSEFLRRKRADIASGRRPADQAPRPDDWRVYRFCSQNVVVAMVLLRYNRDDNVLDVGACLISALSALDHDAPARALCTLLFAESYRSGGDLSLRFVQGTRRDSDPISVPRPLWRWAQRAGIALDRRRGVVPSEAAQRLFVESIQVSRGLRDRLREAPDAATAVCYGIASGLWHPVEVETVLVWSKNPGAVLRGLTNPIDRARYGADVLDVRAGMLVAAAHRRISAGGDSLLDAEDVQQQVAFEVNTDHTCTLTAEKIDLTDWLVGDLSAFPATTLRLSVADAEPDQLEAAVRIAVDRLDRASGAMAVLCARDVLTLSDIRLREIVSTASRAGVMILAAPEYTPGMTIRAAGKLSRARTARQ
ncbi:SMI1/KNR4 family protein [Lentzea aerocolonigenes]|uniref:SMI1/KNR4 family protein n=1 Tax=Lentzea aerocolonigenes TaxID=68170 RepID=UPI0004C36828|nr:SMI1/KNR4 family protein [Lentzea aerocolonigenes]MCP2243358.1 hypothetical protein [Lentzea aerocolonigenes]